MAAGREKNSMIVVSFPMFNLLYLPVVAFLCFSYILTGKQNNFWQIFVVAAIWKLMGQVRVVF